MDDLKEFGLVKTRLEIGWKSTSEHTLDDRVNHEWIIRALFLGHK
jgi:coenzyme F420-reducing hydrogenase delta subunit